MPSLTLRTWVRHVLALVLCTLSWASALAHKPSDSYLTLAGHDGGLVEVSWDIALRDLDTELHLDANDDGKLSWGEVRSQWEHIEGFARGYLHLASQGQDCVPVAAAAPPVRQLIEHTDGQYAVLTWQWQCPAPNHAPWTQAQLDYRLFSLSDPTHRGIVHWRSVSEQGKPVEGGTVVMGTPRPQHTLTWSGLNGAPGLDDQGAAASQAAHASEAGGAAVVPASQEQAPEHSAWSDLWRFIQDGVHHIAMGTDHILFLLSLLLVSVWERPGRPTWLPLMAGWQARGRWQSALGEVLRLVTAFTLAHSITLGLAAFGVLSPPSRWVESLIALSVLVAALDNLFPLLHAPRWVVVFGFGLVHGFGFAGALQDLGLSGSGMALPLLGFNLGVELGQLTLVSLTLPVACLLRRTAFYRWVGVGGGSIFIASMAAIWLIERVFGVVLLGWGG